MKGKKKYFQFDFLREDEISRINWLMGFFVSGIVYRTFRNRPTWTPKEIEEKLKTVYLDAIYEKFLQWLNKKRISDGRDENLYWKFTFDEKMKKEAKRCIAGKIPKFVKLTEQERNGKATRRNLKRDYSRELNKSLPFFDYKCAYCNTVFSAENPLTADHIIPVAKGGEDDLWNLIPACRDCNSRKSDKHMGMWFKEQKFFSEIRFKKIMDWGQEARLKN